MKTPFWEITFPIFDIVLSFAGLEVVGPEEVPRILISYRF